MRRDRGDGRIGSVGSEGQFIFVVHDLDAVVVVTAGLPGESIQIPVEMLYSRILPLFQAGLDRAR